VGDLKLIEKPVKKPVVAYVRFYTNLCVIPLSDGGVRGHALDELDRAKWRFWNGHIERGLIGLVHLRQWAQAQCFDHIPSLKKLEHALSDMIRYLELNADSMPNYGKRYRAGQQISTAFVESAVNEIVAKRMVKKQQMRWNRHTVQSFLDVRNSRVEWHLGKRISALAPEFSANRRAASGCGLNVIIPQPLHALP
jgi:hypothetical protein